MVLVMVSPSAWPTYRKGSKFWGIYTAKPERRIVIAFYFENVYNKRKGTVARKPTVLIRGFEVKKCLVIMIAAAAVAAPRCWN
jgi:hypothetical protein